MENSNSDEMSTDMNEPAFFKNWVQTGGSAYPWYLFNKNDNTNPLSIMCDGYGELALATLEAEDIDIRAMAKAPEMYDLLVRAVNECCGFRHCGCQFGSEMCKEDHDCVFNKMRKVLREIN